MLKIVVCDSGWGGELIADFLSEELNTVEVVRVIDWAHAPYHDRSPEVVAELVEQALRPQIGQVDLIVLGGYGTSSALPYLRAKYPTQRFVDMSYSLPAILHTRRYPHNLAILASALTLQSELVLQLQAELPHTQFVLASYPVWEKLIDDGELSRAQIQEDLSQQFELAINPTARELRAQHSMEFRKRELPLAELLKLSNVASVSSVSPAHKLATNASVDTSANIGTAIAEPAADAATPHQSLAAVDAVLILNTHYLEIKTDLERLFGWQVRVLDFRPKLLHDVCAALKLRGVDGSRKQR